MCYLFDWCCYCCCASGGVVDDDKPEASKESANYSSKESMAVAPAPATVQFWGGGGGIGGRPATPSTSRLPSTRLATGRPRKPAPTIISSLAVSEQTVLKAERRDLTVNAAAKVIPHPDKVAKGGEDAFFIRNDYNGGVLGVADGVSGWAEENVDPALFSKELMAHADAALGTGEIQNDPRQLLAKAHSATASVGAATAIVAILDKQGVLRVANLGDCGLRIIRAGKVVHATAPQQHYFDCPYQLSSEDAQTAADAAVYELGVLAGDTIVMGSDGLFDNVYDKDIESVVRMFTDWDGDSIGSTATALAALASKHALDRRYDSPYALEAVLQGHDLPWWRKVLARQKIGGKIDDITVVVGRIVYAPLRPGGTEAGREMLQTVSEEKSVTQAAATDSKEEAAPEVPIQVSEDKSADAQVSSQAQ